MRSTLLAFLFFLCASPVSAQIVPLNAPAVAVFTHSGENTVGYRLYIDNQTAGGDVAVSALSGGEVRLPIPAQVTAGRKVLQAAAFNAFGETRSPALAFCVGDAAACSPPAPGGLRIELTVKAAAVLEPQADGTVKLRVDGVDASVVVK
ncbi:MAG TPA: hypothetical protein VJ777_28700 [Mycobacterium sp.]|nr:hypothetical protein [Mycobacterium sp.]